jgi:RNA polymerase sigma factor (sigma-70 family)
MAESKQLPSHLSQIPTLWSLVRGAHKGLQEEMASARAKLLERYGGAVKRYLMKSLRDPDATEELSQEFAIRFLRGDFHRADPERGRFRSFVKTALFRLMMDFRKRQRRNPRLLDSHDPEPSAKTPDMDELDRGLCQSWREQLLNRTWQLLAAAGRRSRQPFYQVLRLKADHPEFRAPEIAEVISQQTGQPVNSAHIRQTLHRAREHFAELLLDQVAQSLETPSIENLEEELRELGLLMYCEPVLERRRSKKQ